MSAKSSKAVNRDRSPGRMRDKISCVGTCVKEEQWTVTCLKYHAREESFILILHMEFKKTLFRKG